MTAPERHTSCARQPSPKMISTGGPVLVFEAEQKRRLVVERDAVRAMPLNNTETDVSVGLMCGSITR
jgi:hypothetical protein